MADFGIGGIVGQHDLVVPMELSGMGLDLLWRRQDVDVLREGGKPEKAKENEKFGFHGRKRLSPAVSQSDVVKQRNE